MSLVDHWMPARLGAAMLLLSSCASGSVGSPNQMQGNSGSVEWEVVDMGEVLSRDRSRIRWSYTIVFRETSGSTIEFERVDKNAYDYSLSGSNMPAFSAEFQRRLQPHGELRESYVDSWGWVAGAAGRDADLLPPVTFDRRFVGKNDRGDSVVIRIPVRLRPRVGKRASQPRPLGTLPFPKSVQSGDVGSLAGVWKGFYVDSQYDIPETVTISTDGTFVVEENDPVTNRGQGRVRIEGNEILLTQKNDRGTATLYEFPGRRILVVRVTANRIGQNPFQYSLRLESLAP